MFVAQLLDEFAELLVERFTAKAAGNDFAVGADEERGGNGIDAVGGSGNATPALEVGEVVPRKGEALDGTGPSGFVVVERKTYDVETFGVVFLVGSLRWAFPDGRDRTTMPRSR